MYEIWLMLNIVFEIALTIKLELAIALLVLIALTLLSAKKWQKIMIKPSIYLGLLVGVISFFTIPSLTNSSISEMGYWVDWANLISIALGSGVASMFYIYPVLVLLNKGPK
jgi:hypothetical protein